MSATIKGKENWVILSKSARKSKSVEDSFYFSAGDFRGASIMIIKSTCCLNSGHIELGKHVFFKGRPY